MTQDLHDILRRVSSRRKNAERQKRTAKRWETRIRNEAKAKLLSEVEWWLIELTEKVA